MNDILWDIRQAIAKRMRPLALYAGLPLLLLGWCTEPFWNWDRHVLPSNLAIDAVLASNGESGLMEGCESAVYQLSHGTIARLKNEGIAFLRNGPRPVNENKDNPYSEWRETPGEIDLVNNGHGAKNTVFGLYAIGGCDNKSNSDFRSRELRQVLSERGSYYAVTGNYEGIIIVAPSAGLAAFFYVG